MLHGACASPISPATPCCFTQTGAVHEHVTSAVPVSAGDKLEGLVAEEAAQQAAAASEVSHLKAQLSQAETAAAAAEQQAGSLSTQFAEAQQALIDADRQVCSTAPVSHACRCHVTDTLPP
jgi:hypothetical protein